MTRHPSKLALHELLAGVHPDAAVVSHLQSCEPCARRLDSMRDAAAKTRASVRFARELDRLHAYAGRRTARPARRWPWLLLAPAVLTAASLVLVLRGTTVRPKGSYLLKVIRLNAGGDQEPRFHPGEKVALLVNALGKRSTLVLGVDEKGQVDRIWPPHQATSGPTPEGGSAALDPPFTVTAGSLTLYALFSDAPLSATDAIDRFRERVAAARRTGDTARSLQPPDVPGEQGWARAELDVASP